MSTTSTRAAEEHVVTVDPDGRAIGTLEKRAAHEVPGTLHLAVSVVLFREDGVTLMQRRAAAKYHFPLVWANACCSHPRPGEAIADAAARRVEEELGVTCAPQPAGTFTYRAACTTSGLVEHEFDHVLVAEIDVEPRPNPAEVAEVAWVAPAHLLAGRGERSLAPWFLPVLRIALAAR